MVNESMFCILDDIPDTSVEKRLHNQIVCQLCICKHFNLAAVSFVLLFLLAPKFKCERLDLFTLESVV